MSGPPTLTSQLAMSARWPVGVLATAWAYTWRTTPLHRRELRGTWEEDRPPELPGGIEPRALQTPADGVGPLLHRRYHGRILDSGLSAEALMARLGQDLDRVAPGALARFVKLRGEDGRMAVGDEFVVRMPGPWDGPVRAVEVTPLSIRFATLEGHLEAGQIEWHARDEGDALVFGVESWARGGDRLSHLLHNRLRMAKEVQLHMWTAVIERVTRLAGGRLERGIDIETRRVELSDGA
jgi:hypothetical protein